VIDEEELRGARWFAGKDRRIAGVRAAGRCGPFGLVDVAYADADGDGAAGGRGERYLLLDDGLAWAAVLRGLLTAPLQGDGRIELRPAPPLAALLPAGAPGVQRIPSTDQSNTLVTLDDRLLVKAYRKLEAGIHPEVELGAALAGTAAPVPAHAGSLHWIAADGTDTTIALLQAFVAGAVSGWEEPIEALAAHLRAGTSDTLLALASYAAAGRAAGALHAALADRLGTAADAAAPARRLADAEAALAAAASRPSTPPHRAPPLRPSRASTATSTSPSSSARPTAR
jgi:predicted trehalose synthase